MSAKNPIFGILTDFGFDFAVASIKGVLLQTFPQAQIIDIDHSIEKFNILNGAFVVDKVYPFFPKHVTFLCVVDPGVGSQREPLCVELGNYRFIGPNNGIFHYILKNPGTKVYTFREGAFAPDSVTFHGRDLFAPAAIHLALGDRSCIEEIDLEKIVFLDIDADDRLITYIDSFGNIKTNIVVEGSKPGDTIQLNINGLSLQLQYVRTFTDVQPGELLCYKGSNATLEIAVNQGSAKEFLGVSVGAKVSISS